MCWIASTCAIELGPSPAPITRHAALIASTGARSNIARHYDLSNELFALFLDESMTYSSAWFEEGDSLARFKLERLVQDLIDSYPIVIGHWSLVTGHWSLASSR